MRYTCIASCYHWHGDTKLIFEIGYGAAVGIYATGSYLKDQLLHSICSSIAEGSVDIVYAVTVVASTVPSVQGKMGNLTSALLTSAIATIMQATTTTETVTAPSTAQVCKHLVVIPLDCSSTTPFDPLFPVVSDTALVI